MSSILNLFQIACWVPLLAIHDWAQESMLNVSGMLITAINEIFVWTQGTGPMDMIKELMTYDDFELAFNLSNLRQYWMPAWYLENERENCWFITTTVVGVPLKALVKLGRSVVSAFVLARRKFLGQTTLADHDTSTADTREKEQADILEVDDTSETLDSPGTSNASNDPHTPKTPSTPNSASSSDSSDPETNTTPEEQPIDRHAHGQKRTNRGMPPRKEQERARSGTESSEEWVKVTASKSGLESGVDGDINMGKHGSRYRRV